MRLPSSRLAGVPRPPRLVAVLVAVLTTAALVVARPARRRRRPTAGGAGRRRAAGGLRGPGRRWSAAAPRQAPAAPRWPWPTCGSPTRNLSPAARAAAAPLLARPTDGGADPEQFGWSVAEATPVCSVNFCVHYVASTEDAPPLADVDANGVPDQVTATLDTLESVLDFHTRVLGYRPPATDGTRGGSAQFDVYLSQLAGDGLYGFCAPEQKVPGQTVPLLRLLRARQRLRRVPARPAAEPAGDGGPRVLPRDPVRLRRHRGPLVHGGHRDVGRGALRRRHRRQPAVPQARSARPAAHTRSTSSTPSGRGTTATGSSSSGSPQRYGVEAVHQVWDQADATKGAPDRYSTERRRQGAPQAGHDLRGVLRTVRGRQPAARAVLRGGLGLPDGTRGAHGPPPAGPAQRHRAPPAGPPHQRVVPLRAGGAPCRDAGGCAWR